MTKGGPAVGEAPSAQGPSSREALIAETPGSGSDSIFHAEGAEEKFQKPNVARETRIQAHYFGLHQLRKTTVTKYAPWVTRNA